MIIQICVGSSCHLKGSQEIVKLFQTAIEENKLDYYVTLAGSFCTGKCNREGVTVSIDDTVHTGITEENFNQFFEDHVLKLISEERRKRRKNLEVKN